MMLHLRLLADFKLADGDGRERPFDELLADFNVILLTHTHKACRGSADELLRSFLAETRGVEGVSVHGIDIRSYDAFCNKCCGPHVAYRERELLSICDSGAWVRRLWGVTSDAWILIVSAGRHVLDAGPLTEVERLAMQFSLDVALSPHCTARAPPDCRKADWRDTAA